MSKSLPIKLQAFLDEHDRIVVLYPSLGKLERLRPGTGLADLIGEDLGAKTLSIELCDFFQRETIYRVYGATLDASGHQIVEHWDATGHGVRATFELPTRTTAAQLKLVIGVTPHRPATAAAPPPFLTYDRAPRGGGGLPIAYPEEKGEGVPKIASPIHS